MNSHGWMASTSKFARTSNRGSTQQSAPHHTERQQGFANPPSSTIDTTVDPFLLDFGTSVNVNEDLRRVIRGEIQEIEESINVIGTENKKEETVERQLRHDLSHSYSEMTNLSRCANDQLENVHVHTTFLGGLENTLHVGLVASSGIRTNAVVTPNKTGANANGGTCPAVESNKTIIQKQSNKLKAFATALKETAKQVDELVEARRVKMDTIKMSEQRVEKEDLFSVVAEYKREGKRLEVEFKQEQDKLQAIKRATHKKRTESGANAQQLADLTKQLDATRRQAEGEKAELMKNLSAVKEQEQKAQAEIDSMITKLDTFKAYIREVARQEELLKIRADSQANLEKEQKRHDDLLRVREELAAKLEASKAQRAVSEQELMKAQALDAEARKRNKENDEKHNELIVPGRVELSDIAEKKEKIAKIIEDTQKSNSELQITEKELLDSKLETKRLVLDELTGLEEKAKALKAKKESANLAQLEAKKSINLEIQEHLDLEEKLNAAYATESKRLKEFRQELSKRRQEKVEEATKKVDDELAKGRGTNHVLKAAFEMMEKTDEKLKKIGGPGLSGI